MIDVAIIGSGNLGRHHMAGVSLSENNLHIHMVDPNQIALKEAKKRFDTIGINSKNKKISFHSGIKILPNNLFIAIIATNADIRKEIIEALIKHCKLKYMIIEKVVFQKSKDFEPVTKILKEKNIRTWVNFPRRVFDVYKKIRNQVSGQNISMEVLGNEWGLACNSIHFIDLFSFITNDSNFNFDCNSLDEAIYESKRKNFKELKGSFKLKTKKWRCLVIKR